MQQLRSGNKQSVENCDKDACNWCLSIQGGQQNHLSIWLSGINCINSCMILLDWLFILDVVQDKDPHNGKESVEIWSIHFY